MDARASSACWSPTPPCATRTSRCWRRACAPSTWRRSRRTTRACCRSCSRWNAGAARPSTSPCASCSEDPWERLAQLARARCRICCCRCCCVGRTPSATPTIPTTSCASSSRARPRRGIDVFRIFDCLNWVENMRVAIDAVLEAGKLCEAAICYTGNLSDPRETKYTLDYYLKLARELEGRGRPRARASRTWRGCCRPRAAYALVKALQGGDRAAGAFPHARYQRHRRGQRARGGRCGRRRGRRRDRCHGGLTSQPNLGSMVEALRSRAARHAASIRTGCGMISSYWEQVRRQYARVRKRHSRRRLRGVRARHAGRPVHESAGAGALARHRRGALAGGGARLRRGQRHVRRHRQGDADLQGRRRHGAAHGDERPDAASRCSTRRRRSRFPNRWCSCFAASSASRPAASRRRCSEGAEGRAAAHRPARCGAAAGRSRGRARAHPSNGCRGR